MSETITFDPSAIEFESAAFPTEADMKLWDGLAPEQQRAVVTHSLNEAERGGTVSMPTVAEVIEEAKRRAVRKRGS